jgi:uncharacterized protein (TIGR03437 family)
MKRSPLAFLCLMWCAVPLAAAPVISSADLPGVLAGDPTFSFTITGSGFVPGSVVLWTSTPLATVYVSPTTLTATVPASQVASPGNPIIVVTNPDGAVSSQYITTVAPFVISSIYPALVQAGSPDTLLFIGGHFHPTTTVLFNGSAVPTTFVDNTRLTTTVPARLLASPGTITVTANSPNGLTTAPMTLTVWAPAVPTGVSPALLDAGGQGAQLTVAGTGFVPGATVLWSGQSLATTFVSATQLTARVPAALLTESARHPIAVQNPNAPPPTNTIGPVVVRPVLTAVSPTSVTISNSAATLTVTGAGFTPNSLVHLSAALVEAGLGTTYVNSTTLRATISPGLLLSAGTALISVADAGTSGTVPLTIVAPQPSISTIYPTSVAAGGPATSVALTGSGFTPGSTVLWNGTPLPTKFGSFSSIGATVPASLIASPGIATITVAQPGGPPSAGVQITITGPPATGTIAVVTPSAVTAGGAGFTLTVSGAGFQSGAVVQWNGAVLPTVYVSSTQLTAQVAASMIASSGTASITVLNPGQQPSSAFLIAIQPGALDITLLTPAYAAAGSAGFAVTIQGAGFAAGDVAQWNGLPLATRFVSSTQISADVPAALIAAPGSAAVTVVAPNGTRSRAWDFTIRGTIQLTAVTPSSYPAGGPPFPLTIDGAAFAAGAAARWNGMPLATIHVSATRLTAQVTADLVAAPGIATITAVNLDGSVSLGAAFQVVPFSLSRITPDLAVAGWPSFTITALGQGFLPGATVYWNGSPLPTTFVSDAGVNAQVSAALVANAGRASIFVINPGGGTTDAVDYQIQAVPQGTAVTIAAGGVINAASNLPNIATGSLISIYGTKLAAASAAVASVPLPLAIGGTSVLIDGVAVPLLYVSPSQINAQVPYEIAPGDHTVSVQTSDGPSVAPQPMTVRPAAPGVLMEPNGQHALAQNASDFSLNLPQNPARPGDYVIVYVTGQGQVDPPVATGAAAPSDPLSRPLAAVEVRIGGKPAVVGFAGLAPAFVGLLQLNVQVPAVPPGEQSLDLAIGGAAANPTFLSVGGN